MGVDGNLHEAALSNTPGQAKSSYIWSEPRWRAVAARRGVLNSGVNLSPEIGHEYYKTQEQVVHCLPGLPNGDIKSWLARHAVQSHVADLTKPKMRSEAQYRKFWLVVWQGRNILQCRGPHREHWMMLKTLLVIVVFFTLLTHYRNVPLEMTIPLWQCPLVRRTAADLHILHRRRLLDQCIFLPARVQTTYQ